MNGETLIITGVGLNPNRHGVTDFGTGWNEAA